MEGGHVGVLYVRLNKNRYESPPKEGLRWILMVLAHQDKETMILFV